MKNLIILLLIGLAIQASATTRPENIPSKLAEVKTSSWYMEKFRSWQTYLEKQPEDRAGWVEYFKAGYYGNMSSVDLTMLSEEIATRFTDGFEAHYVKSKLQGWSPEGIQALRKAVDFKNEKELLPERILLSEISKNDRTKYTQLLYNSNTVYPSLLNYSYNVLMSVGDNGILFTKGENTTIPLWILQDVMKVRNDVTVLNIDLLANNAYRDDKFETLGIRMEGTSLASLPELNPQLNFYYALTLPRKNLEEIENRLYVVGLTSKHSEEKLDNYSILKQNIEERFLLDYLTVDFNGEPKSATGKTLEPNYIVPFMLLKQYYEQIGDMQQANSWKNNILTVADRSQIKSRVELLMKSNSSTPANFKKTELDAKNVDKRMTKVKDNIYAGKYEVTNKEYNLFLNYLKENSYTNLYKVASIDLSKYNDDPVNKRFHQIYHTPSALIKGEHFEVYPVMDISHDAAKLYCEWLTVQYNMQDKRKFNKVKFRLPTRKEWTMAALGFVDFQTWEFEDNIIKAWTGLYDDNKKSFDEYRIGDYENVDYPWCHSDWERYRSRIINEKGCYLANIKTPETITCASGNIGDGFLITGPVGSYFSSDMGLFDVIGNVAEMIDEEGVAMGGSWNHSKEESTITSINKYDKADPAVGFRIFMEVIEE